MFEKISDEAVAAMTENEKAKLALTRIVLPALVVVAGLGFVSGIVQQAYVEIKKNKSN